MDTRIDDVVGMLTSRRSRRAALVAGGAGLALGALGRASAQEATPTADEGPAWLFVQRFGAATLAPDPAMPDEFILTLDGLDPAILAFTDHPDRLVATVPTAAFAEMVAAEEVDPLNATLVANPDEGDGEVSAVVVLEGAEYDAAAGSVAYRVAVLAEAEGPLVAEPITPSTGTQVFRVGHLFVDDTLGCMACNITSELEGAGKAVKAPAAAAGYVSAARSIHKMKRQHDKPKHD
jgi:hypothetical protein